MDGTGAPEAPGEADNALREHIFNSGCGGELREEAASVVVEFGLAFGFDDVSCGPEAVPDGVFRDAGLALRGAGAGGFLCVTTVCLDLCFCSHDKSFLIRILHLRADEQQVRSMLEHLAPLMRKKDSIQDRKRS